MKVKEAPGSEGHAARPGVLFAVAAVTVTAPRLALAFLAADGVAVPTPWRIDLLAVSSVATAVVLTGGTAYLAHAIAVASTGRGVLVALWTAALVCASRATWQRPCAAGGRSMTTPSPAPLPPRFLRPHQVEALYGLSRKYLALARARGDGPPFYKPSAKLVLYSVDELEKWLAQRRRVSTCDPGPAE